MAGTVELPVVGTVDKKWVYIGGATIAAVVGWAYYSRSRSGPAVIEEGVDGADILPGDEWGNAPGSTGNSNVNQPNDVIDTIAEWTADVVQKLAATDWDTGFVYATIGKWIAGEGLTEPEKNLVRAAIAASGQPPGGPYPIKTAQPNPNPGTNPPPPPVTNPPPAQAPTHVSVPLEYNLYQWVDDLNRQFPGLNLTFTRMFGTFKGDPTALNPEARKYMDWRGSGTKTPVFYAGWPGGGKTLGIPPMRIR